MPTFRNIRVSDKDYARAESMMAECYADIDMLLSLVSGDNIYDIARCQSLIELYQAQSFGVRNAGTLTSEHAVTPALFTLTSLQN